MDTLDSHIQDKFSKPDKTFKCPTFVKRDPKIKPTTLDGATI